MTLPNYKELDKLTTLIEIEKEIFFIHKKFI